jgi:signal recognition particle subunit SRP54
VLDAMVGQDAVNTAEAFRDGVGFTGVVLTKLDGDARGGAALSVRQVTGEPILFASNGERQDEFDVFHPDRMASRILGMGDVLSLIEQAEEAFEAGQAEAAARKMGEGDFTLEDFLEQMQSVRKMGPIANILGMLPGAAGMKDQLASVDEKQLDRVQAIIRGMTPAERADPKIINGSRRLRIANGSGVGVTDVNQLVERFFEARKMMKNMAGQFGLPGMGGGRKAARSARKGGGSRQRGGGKTMPAIAGIAAESSRGQRSVGSYETPGLNQLPPGLAGLDQLPDGFDPGALTFPGNSGGGGRGSGGGKKGNKKRKK